MSSVASSSTDDPSSIVDPTFLYNDVVRKLLSKDYDPCMFYDMISRRKRDEHIYGLLNAFAWSCCRSADEEYALGMNLHRSEDARTLTLYVAANSQADQDVQSYLVALWNAIKEVSCQRMTADWAQSSKLIDGLFQFVFARVKPRLQANTLTSLETIVSAANVDATMSAVLEQLSNFENQLAQGEDLIRRDIRSLWLSWNSLGGTRKRREKNPIWKLDKCTPNYPFVRTTTILTIIWVDRSISMVSRQVHPYF